MNTLISQSDFDKFKAFIEQHISFNSIEWALLKSKLKKHCYKKGEVIHHAGEICTKLMFINDGIVRAYIIDDNGKDYTWSLFFNDQDSGVTNVYVVDYDSFINKYQSSMYFEVVEDCHLLSIDYESIQFLYQHFKKGERLGRIMAELAYSYTHNRFIDRLTKSASERFEDFILNTPFLLEKVPQYHIATFLGIAPQSLSRLKNKLKD